MLKIKVIRKFKVTDASEQASQEIDNLPDEDDNGERFYADTAYTGQNRKEHGAIKWRLKTKNL